MIGPEFCVLQTDGTNCDRETQFALESSGGDASIVHVNDLRNGDRDLSEFQGLVLPGGFTYGDDIASGKVLATELTAFLGDKMRQHIERGRPILGICNGFQVLLKSGLLLGDEDGRPQATLTHNTTGLFRCSWVDLTKEDTVCKFVENPDRTPKSGAFPMQIAHGEGRFVASEKVVRDLQANRQIAFRYATRDGWTADSHPYNPNGSMDNIAGVCDEAGLILGMMPHPERSFESMHPDRTRNEEARVAGRMIFRNLVRQAGES